MKKQLDVEKNNNQILKDENTNLKNKINILNNEINNLKQYKDKNKLLEEEIKKKETLHKNDYFDKNSLEKEIKELKEKLNKANKIIDKQILDNQELKNQINSIKNIDNIQINNLKNDIIIKNNEIAQLKKQIENINLNNNRNNILININDIKIVTIKSTDERIFYTTPCTGKETFAEIEEKLYKEYPEYRETNNSFFVDGHDILRFKTINDNKIDTGKQILLIKPS